jgi:NAD(P)-dependent dehydrogenase (short-subunit alcohol dehydrogenase family)
VSASTLSLVQIDISSDSSIEKAVETVGSQHGRLDVLVNNAGGSFDHELVTGEKTIREVFNATWDLNVSGTHVLTNLAVPLLLESSDPRLLFITSGTATLAETDLTVGPSARLNAKPPKGWPKTNTGGGPFGTPAYRSSKTGLNMVMREWHRILWNDGVKVWAISPGFLATGLAGLGAAKLKEVSFAISNLSLFTPLLYLEIPRRRLVVAQWGGFFVCFAHWFPHCLLTDDVVQMGARDPALGGAFIKDVIQGKRDADVGKAIRSDSIQPW